MNTKDKDQKEVVAIIPAYNEARHIGKIVKKLRQIGFDVLVVDDGSGDFTGQVAEEAGAMVIRHQQNKGKAEAIRTGARWALQHNYKAALFLDGDGQHLPEEATRFLKEFQKSHADIIIGNRMWNPTSMPLVRKLSNSFSSYIISLLAGRKIADSQSGYRLLSARALKFLLDSSSQRFVLESEFIIDGIRSGLAYSEVPITCLYAEERSHYRPIKDSAEFILFALKKGLSLCLSNLKNKD